MKILKYITWKTILVFMILFFISIAVLLYSFRKNDIKSAVNQSRNEFITLYYSIINMRRWASIHEGVFIKERAGIKPNPYLKNNFAVLNDGTRIIRVNPAWMTRMIFELSNQQTETPYKLKLTSLNPVNPDNKADAFETRALHYFTDNRKKNFYFEFPGQNENTIHFMGVLKNEKSCLKCHTDEKLNDIRGGIHISLPADSLNENLEQIILKNNLYFLALFSLGFLMLLLLYLYFRVEEKNKKLYTKFNTRLKHEVEEKTENLQEMYKRENYLREIMKTVGEINRLMISSEYESDFLQKSCDILSSYKNYKLVWIGFSRGNVIDVNFKSQDPTNYLTKDFTVMTELGDPRAQGPAGRSILENKTIIINNTQEDRSFEPWKERAKTSGFIGVIGIPIRFSLDRKPIGTMLVYTSSSKGFDPEEINMLEELAGDIGFALSNFAQKESLSFFRENQIKNYEETILSFVKLIEERDSYTAGHSVRVAEYCRKISAEMNLPEHDINILEKAAILHDIGKVVTPDAILLNPGKLSNLEYDLLKQHVETGYRILSGIENYTELAEIIKFHHEKHDGTGYPNGAKGNEIPLPARIMSVADAFDAMTSNRIYREKFSPEQALQEIMQQSGYQFHPEVVDAALNALQNRMISDSADQLPENQLEQKRFSYFFDDKLTGFHNKDYLTLLIIKKNIFSMFKYICYININEFHNYNQTHGWDKGDHVLYSLAVYLRSTLKEEYIFRIHGDDFLIFTNKNPDEVNAILSNHDNIRQNIINIQFSHVKSEVAENLHKNKILPGGSVQDHAAEMILNLIQEIA